MTTVVRLQCPECSKHIKAPSSVVGRRVVCPGCESKFEAKPLEPVVDIIVAEKKAELVPANAAPVSKWNPFRRSRKPGPIASEDGNLVPKEWESAKRPGAIAQAGAVIKRDLIALYSMLRVLVLLVFVVAGLFLILFGALLVQGILHPPTPSYPPQDAASFAPLPTSSPPSAREEKQHEKPPPSIHVGEIWVGPYTRKDGVHVKGHWRKK